MEKKWILTTVLSGLLSIPLNAEPQQEFPIKIMTYNVFLGFHTYPKMKFEAQRLANAQKIVKEENPDILLLQESFYAIPNSTNLFIDYQKEFQYPYAAVGSWGDFQGNVILSKYLIVNSEVLPLGERTALRVQLEVCGNHLLTIDNIHLSPYVPEKEKSNQLEQILLKDKHYYIVGGDFNALSPDDSYIRQNILPDFLAFYGIHGVSVADDWLSCETIKTIKKRGMHDAFSSSDYTYPTNLTKTDKTGAIKIDYLFHSPELKVENAHVNKTGEAEQASDHYPFIAIFLIR